MKEVKRFSFSVVACMIGLLGLSSPTACAHADKKTGSVETHPVLRNVLLEEFTAIHCSYCPQAHAIAQNLHHVLGNRLQVMAVHVSDLATPGGNEQDFRTDFGPLWFAAHGSSAMPSGDLNRHRFEELASRDSAYSISRAYWYEAARSLLNDTAEVNLYVEAVLDTLRRKIEVRVEYFYPAVIKDEFSLLTVVLAENYVRGTQTGATGGAQYLHKHIVRNLFTDVWGDTVREIEKGKIGEKKYSLVLPEQYGNNHAPDFSRLEVIAFMSRPDKEVLNSTSAQVDYDGRYAAPEVSLSAPSLDKGWSRAAIPVRIENLGTDTVESLSFSVVMGNETYYPELSQLKIPYGEEQELELSLGQYPFSKIVRYMIKVTEINGVAKESNMISDYINAPVEVETDKLNITITTDEHGGDITYTVRNRAGDVLESGGPFAEGETLTEKIEWNCQRGEVYSFEIRDAFLDGFNGGYKVEDVNGKNIVSTNYVGHYGAVFSFVYPEHTADESETGVAPCTPRIRMSHNPVPASRPVNELTFSGFGAKQLDMEVFDVQGKVVFRNRVSSERIGNTSYRLDTQQFRSGFYFIKVGGNGNAAVEKMVIQ